MEPLKHISLHDLLLSTRDGDWGKDSPEDGKVPYRVIRGADFPKVLIGDISTIPLCYLNKDSVKRRTLEPYDIIIETAGGNRDRPTGRTLFIKERLLKSLDYPATCASFCRYLRVNPEKADSYYVFWHLQYLYQCREMWKHQIQHTGVARFQYTKFAESTLIPLPSTNEQKRIAHILGTMDDKMELLRRQNKTLENIAQAIFKEWFVNFNFPDKNGKPYKSSGGKMIDSNSDFGEIPEGWRVGRLRDEFQIIMGQSPDGESYNESGDGMIFFQGRAEFQDRFPSTRLYTTEPKRIAEYFDVLVSVRAPVGDINVAFDRCCIGRGLAAVRGNYKSYALYKIKSLQDAFNKFEAEGTVFGCIGKDDFANIEAIIPDENIIKLFEDIASKMDGKYFNNYSQIHILNRLRDMLLPKLMRGEIRVKGS